MLDNGRSGKQSQTHWLNDIWFYIPSWNVEADEINSLS